MLPIWKKHPQMNCLFVLCLWVPSQTFPIIFPKGKITTRVQVLFWVCALYLVSFAFFEVLEGWRGHKNKLEWILGCWVCVSCFCHKCCKSVLVGCTKIRVIRKEVTLSSPLSLGLLSPPIPLFSVMVSAAK